MAVAEADRSSRAGLLTDLPGLVARQSGFAEILGALDRGASGTIDGAWGAAAAVTAAALVQARDRPWLIVLPTLAEVDDFLGDLTTLLSEGADSGGGIASVAAWESLPREVSPADPIWASRLRLCMEIASKNAPRLFVSPLAALLQPVPPAGAREGAFRTLRVGAEVALDELMRWLFDGGFERTAAIERPGEFSLHGGILDVWTADAADPYRIEFFGDEVESIRRFDGETQRKIEELECAQLLVAQPGQAWAMPESNGERPSLLELLPAEMAVLLLEPVRLVDEGKHFLARLDEPEELFSVEQTLARLTDWPSVTISTLGADSLETTCRLPIESIERFSGTRGALAELDAALGRDENVLLACHNAAEVDRLSELLREYEGQGAAPAGDGTRLSEQVALCLGRLSQGFRLVSENLVVISDHELFNRTEVVRTSRKKRHESRAIETFLDLNEGDLIVHLANGIGRYRGMKLLEKGEQREEHLELEFGGGVRVFVPVSLIHLVQKYVGATKAAPSLSKLGTSAWGNKKRRVADAVEDMASDMLRLQAARESKPGIACPPDSHFVEEFGQAFPYDETADQVTAIAAAIDDMEQNRPMDRLICGDVGYGKTEVAMRAAFKAVDAGRQVAVLVPTTVLAEQHHRSFAARMAEFPIVIESLSRFRTKKAQGEIIAGLKRGGVDIVIGTHRLVQRDVAFKDLGLLVIDEEQRFGVEVKEALKSLRLEVDVMTLSATPIPRTLHMALLGIRDISNLTTPPRDRQAIETRMSRWDPSLIRHAINREINRGGQVYFVHNRVHDITNVRDKIQAIVPEITIGIVHGQMAGHELETTMTAFVRGEIDLLLATTIIESGLDIPNANTIFIHQADRYGLADMHQLRGRVGRYKNRAYCYLLLEEGKPLNDQAAKRLKAIEEFRELGAGFKIAMRDLEIRGAGNILGSEQSGHISSVGYELYCQLLENAVRHLKGEAPRQPLAVNIDLPVSAYYPNSYIPPGRIKIELYRRLSNVRSFDELEQFREELRDRFGVPPAPAGRLLAIKEVQLLCRNWKIDEARLEDERFAVFVYRDESMIQTLAKLVGSRFRVVDRKSAYYLLPDGAATNEVLLTQIRDILMGTRVD